MSNERKPVRIQRRRTKGWRMPENTVYVGRPTKWGNPWNANTLRFSTDGDLWGENRPSTREEQVRAYRRDITCADHWCQEIDEHPWTNGLDASELRGKNLACWCPLDQPCHADVLLEIANQEPDDA